jgi:hypothetical protein
MSSDTKPRPRPKTVADWKEDRRQKYRQAGDKGGFRLLPTKVINSDAFNDLSKSAKLVLLLGLRQIDYWHKKYKHIPRRETSIGPLRNDGRFSLPSNLLKERGIKSSQTITEARKEIVAAGFWEVVETGPCIILESSDGQTIGSHIIKRVSLNARKLIRIVNQRVIVIIQISLNITCRSRLHLYKKKSIVFRKMNILRWNSSKSASLSLAPRAPTITLLCIGIVSLSVKIKASDLFQ